MTPLPILVCILGLPLHTLIYSRSLSWWHQGCDDAEASPHPTHLHHSFRASETHTMEDVQPLHPPRPRRQRKTLSAGKCLLYTVLAIGAALISAFLISAGYGVWTAWKSISDPHSVHRLDKAAEKNVSDVNLVRAIIDDQTRFDVAVTVWTTLPDYEQDEEIRGLTFVQADQKGLSRPKEQVLFSDIVLRDVTLRSKSIATTVKYRLPLDRLSVHFQIKLHYVSNSGEQH